MITQKTVKKKKIYTCLLCDYNTCDKQDFKRHKMTRKHKKLENGNKKTAVVEFRCSNCNKIYKHKSGLSRHKKKCFKVSKYSVENPKKLDNAMVTQKSQSTFENEKNEKL